jgi:hypothetical protein
VPPTLPILLSLPTKIFVSEVFIYIVTAPLLARLFYFYFNRFSHVGDKPIGKDYELTTFFCF